MREPPAQFQSLTGIPAECFRLPGGGGREEIPRCRSEIQEKNWPSSRGPIRSGL